MTISSTVRIAGPYIGSGAATVFPFAFKVFAAAEMQVAKLNTTSNVETILVLNTDYTVQLNGDQNGTPGGTITLPAVLSSGYNLTITSDIANLQPTDLTNQGGFYPEVITDALDRATIQIQQLDQNSRAIKIPLSDGVLDMTTPVVSARQGKYLAFDTFGLPVVSSGTGSDSALRTDLANATAVSAGSRLSGFRQDGTGATARTVDAKLKDTVSVKDFGAVGDGVTDDTVAIQAAITAGAGKTVILTSGTYKTTSVLTMSAANTNLVGVGKVNTTIAWTGAGGAYVVGVTSVYGTTGNAAILVTGSNCTIDGLTIKGPTAASYVAAERLVVVCGTATGSRVNRFSISNCFVKESGSAGILLVFVSDFRIQDCEVSNIGYEAIATISCNRGMITSNYVHDITPGTVGNMYCISLSHDSSLWATDQTTSPFTDDVIVSGNRCENCAWEGITNHGGNRHTVIGNQIYNVPHCISLGLSSGPAADYSGGDHVVMGNYCDAGPTYANNAQAYCNFGGGALQTLTNVKIIGNTFRRLGVANSGTEGAIKTSLISGLHISGNFIKSWRGTAIYVASGSTIYIGGNDISEMAAADSIGYAIRTDNNIPAIRIIGNTIRTDGGTIANRGINIFSGQTTPVVMQANEIEATLISVHGQLITNNNTPELRYITSSAATYDVSNGGSHMTLVFDLAGIQTITNFTNAKLGQQLTIINTTANNLTIDRTNAYLSGGVSSVLGQYDSLRIVYYTRWYALGAVSANS